jgi:ABC-type Fe3+/spermidine/putrescine transport system ATPase subunit
VTAFLELDGLTRRFGGTAAVDVVSLAIGRGEVLALLGPSGSGKTTTLRLLAGFEIPDAGRVVVDGLDVTRAPPVARRFGMVFQHYALFPHLDVRGNVAFGLESLGVAAPELDRRVAAALELVDLGGFERRRIAQLSVGSSSGWRSPGRWRRSRGCSFWTSRSPTWIPRSASARAGSCTT